jgi:hypothetical protein
VSGPRTNGRMWKPNHFVPVLPTSAPPVIRCSSVQHEVSEVSLESSDQAIVVDVKSESSIQVIQTPNPIFDTPDSVPALPLDGQVLTVPISALERTSIAVRADYMSLIEVLQRLKSASSDLPKKALLGIKENVSFVLDNSDNHMRYLKFLSLKYPSDDKGAYEKPSVHTFVYRLVHGQLQKDPKLKFDMKSHTIVGPVVSNEDHFVIRKVFNTLKRNPAFQRRTTMFFGVPSDHSEVLQRCMVEYVGPDLDEGSSEVPHGNSKHKTAPYIHCNDDVMEEARKLLLAKTSPKEVYDKLLNVRNPIDSVRDLKQVSNLNARLNTDEIEQALGKSVADDVVKMMSDLIQGKTDYVRKVWIDQSGRPCYALYFDWQIEDIRNNCTTKAKHPSVLGIDRTFNIGPCYLTITCYQQMNVRRTKTLTNPIIPGPMYLHWDGKYQTYADFLHHLSVQLDNPCQGIELSGSLLMGSDEELALTKAAEKAFPSATFMLCTRHLQENTNRHLIGQKMDDDAKEKLIQTIYGTDGLTSATSKLEFFQRKLNIDDTPFTNGYFENLANKLWEKVVQPRISCSALPINWKNNNSESFNNIVKLGIGWVVS